MYISLVPSSRHDVVKSDKSYFREQSNPALVTKERYRNTYFNLRAPYNNKYLIFSYHSPFSTRENAKNMLAMYI